MRETRCPRRPQILTLLHLDLLKDGSAAEYELEVRDESGRQAVIHPEDKDALHALYSRIVARGDFI